MGLTDTYTYTSFGVPTATGSNPNRFRHTGREWDSETGLYYYRARYYDPSTGRFLTEDPMHFDGGSVNFYSYVADDPVNNSDPDGRRIVVIGNRDCYEKAKFFLKSLGLQALESGFEYAGWEGAGYFVPVVDYGLLLFEIGKQWSEYNEFKEKLGKARQSECSCEQKALDAFDALNK